MKNRFTKIISVLAASTMLSTSAIADTYFRKEAISVNSTDIQALTLDLRRGVDTKGSSIESSLIDLRCDISCDSDGYTYVDFVADKPITIEDIEIPVSFFDSVATAINATSDPCDVELPEGYWMQTGYASGEILDDEGSPVTTYQFIRSDNKQHTIDGKIITLRFAFSPMNMTNDTLHIPVMRWFQLEEKPAKRWDNLVGQIITLIVAGVVGFFLARIGI